MTVIIKSYTSGTYRLLECCIRYSIEYSSSIKLDCRSPTPVASSVALAVAVSNCHTALPFTAYQTVAAYVYYRVT